MTGPHAPRLERPSAREAFPRGVPVCDLLFAQAPAEQDVLVVSPREEVDQPFVEILDHSAQLVNPLDATRDPGRLFLDPILHSAELGGVQPAAVTRDPPEKLRVALLRRSERFSVCHHPFRERAHSGEHFVRLLAREVPLLCHRETVALADAFRMGGVGAVQRVRTGRSARFPRAAAGAILAVAGLLLVTGCGQRSEPTGPVVEVYPVTVDQVAGPPVVLDRRPDSVIATTPQAAGLLSSVLGREIATSHSAQAGGLVVTTPEGLTSKPGRTYTAPDSSIDDVERALADLGLLLDRPIQARRLIEEIETKRKLVHERLRGTKTVSVFVDTGFFSTISNHSLLGNLLEEAGGENVAGGGPQAGPFDVGRLVELDPDFYLTTSDSGTTLAELRRDPRTRRLRAIRDGHFAILASRVLQPGGKIGTELVALARYLHADAFR